MNNSRIFKIGTRGSKLALTQAHLVQEKLHLVGVETELVIIKTTGDKITNKPLYDIGGKALFLKEIEEALLKKEIDLAVHSMKDVPADLPEGLVITAVLEREDPRDVLIAKFPDIQSLPKGTIVGTSSVRRAAQVLAINPDVEVKSIRGNVDSRLNKYLNREFDAIILASAGLKRLNITHPDFSYIDIDTMIPAVGQGVIAIEIRESDQEFKEITQKINHQKTWIELQAERGFLETIQGSCRTPMGALAQMNGDILNIRYFLADIDGSNFHVSLESCSIDEAYETGRKVALRMMNE